MNMKGYASIDEYIQDTSPELQKILQKMRKTINSCVPNGEEAIRYSMPTIRFNGKNLVHFAVQKEHVGFYPTPSAVAKFEKQLKKYDTSKGTVRFPYDAVPYDLIEKITTFRVKEEQQKAKNKK